MSEGARAERTSPLDEVARFRADLAEHGLLTPGEALGTYARGPVVDRVVEAVEALIGRLADPGAEIMRFPPVMARTAFAATKYGARFPHLAGSVHCFCGDDSDHDRVLASDDGWTEAVRPSAVVLAPASCYPVYGLIAARGPLPADGLLVDAASWCFRHEPSSDPIRMLSFQQREQVCFGTEAQVAAFKQRWVERVQAMFRDLALPATFGAAHDPFFGRLGRLMAGGQAAQALKFEFTLPIATSSRPDACGSYNDHLEHFSRAFGIRTADGGIARTACAGFGLERLAMALFRHHGFLTESWPDAVRRTLWPKH
jgi:seryl-tRNA synthetase